MVQWGYGFGTAKAETLVLPFSDLYLNPYLPRAQLGYTEKVSDLQRNKLIPGRELGSLQDIDLVHQGNDVYFPFSPAGAQREQL